MKTSFHRRRSRGRRAASLIELVISMTVSSGAAVLMVSLILVTAVEQKRALADHRLQADASRVQDKILGILREMSQTQSTQLGSSATVNGRTVYREIVFARGGPPAPREVLKYDAANDKLFHDPDRSVANNETDLFVDRPWIRLTDCYFAPTLRPDGAVDRTAMEVFLAFDDNGASGRGNSDLTEYRYSFVIRYRNF